MNELTKGITRYDDKRQAEAPYTKFQTGVVKVLATATSGYTVLIKEDTHRFDGFKFRTFIYE